MDNQKQWDLDFLKMAYIWGQRSTCPRLNVGAILVKNREIKSGSYNGAPKGMPECEEVGCKVNEENHCTRTVHAEENAIIFSDRDDSQGSTMYVTHSTCYDCQKRIINAGIERIVYSESYKENYELARKAGIKITHLPLKEKLDKDHFKLT